MINVLVIDDDEQLRLMLEKTLTKAGYTVTTAANGKDGLVAFNTMMFDLIITDIIMPEKEGLETIISMRTSAYKPAIIAISGGGKTSADKYLQLAKGLGADLTLEKPFSREELLLAIKKVIGLHQ